MDGGDSGAGESIRVVVRVRPLNKKEVASGEQASLHVDPSRGEVTIPGVAQPFCFDACFPPGSTQDLLYDACAKEVVSGCLEGFNGTIFAYGQTGAGKTWTMQGSPDEPGLIPRSFRALFAGLEAAHAKNSAETLMVRCSYLEVYNETIRDLLAPPGAAAAAGTAGLQVKEDVKAGRFFGKDLTDKVVGSVAAMEAFVDEGQGRRAVAKTNMNAESSRSHAIFTVVVERDGGQVQQQAERASRGLGMVSRVVLFGVVKR